MFLVYVNGISNATSQRCILFADDTTLLVRANETADYEININKELTDIKNWTANNNLNINLSNLNNPLRCNIDVNSYTLKETSNVKFLGITIDSHLDWKSHLNLVCSKLDRLVFVLRKLRNTLSVDAAITAHHGYVSSVLNYGWLIWGNSSDVGRSFILQKKCIRLMLSLRTVTDQFFKNHAF